MALARKGFAFSGSGSPSPKSIPADPLHPAHGDLRIAPEGWKPADADPNAPLSHFDLRVKEVKPEREPE